MTLGFLTDTKLVEMIKVAQLVQGKRTEIRCDTGDGLYLIFLAAFCYLVVIK